MDSCIPVRGRHMSPPCPSAISRAVLIRCSGHMQSYICLSVPKELFSPGPGATEHVTWDGDSRGSAEVTPDLGHLVRPYGTPVYSGQSSLCIFSTFCLSQAYMMVENKGNLVDFLRRDKVKR